MNVFTWLFDHLTEFHHRRHPHIRLLLLTVNNSTGEFAIAPFIRKGERHMAAPANPNNAPAVTVNVGHVATTTIVQLDTNGNPMLTPVTFDSPPTWAQATPATDTLAVGSGNLSATETAIAAGSDTITVTVLVGGVSYVATQPITVTPAPQVFGGIQLNTTVQ